MTPPPAAGRPRFHVGSAPIEIASRPLDALFRDEGCDKASFDRVAGNGHGYAEHYERELGPIREVEGTELPRRTLLEIGIFGGASMRAFARWLGPNWRIVGLDVQLYAEAMPPPDRRTYYYCGNARDRDFCRQLGEERGPFDLVIDDGSHRSEDQIRAFENFWPFVKPGGLLVIEDLHANFWGGPPFDHGALDFLATVADDCHGRGKWATWSGVHLGRPEGRELEVRSVRHYRNMVVVEKYRESPWIEGRVFHAGGSAVSEEE